MGKCKLLKCWYFGRPLKDTLGTRDNNALLGDKTRTKGSFLDYFLAVLCRESVICYTWLKARLLLFGTKNEIS